ncbi:SAM-dependent methyltransferase [Shewanella sairae]|uniref:SAM-dependent methyltransferase n=1 Tax=Shewanella sairae TaxID=190310 RepID=A0ABQ4PPN0_9GAMM|nr:methyltransferase domain-containing protein [Shewanella sairae]MCL1132178.1 methyltransferase domain-containing protein [Shewanella sairae]GIU50767.1 SAM-dependent methyltransferase [Shewanella sairae]
MNSIYLCPVCQSPFKVHEESKGLHCENKHHFDVNEHGYWVFSQPKKLKTDSRAIMRAKRYVLESGIYVPLAQAMARVIAALPQVVTADALSQLDFDCGDGYFLRTLKEILAEQTPALALSQTGICEAENAIFAAAKAEPTPTYIVSTLKHLPFANESFDLVTLIDKQLKGKELTRVLKQDGVLLQVAAGPRHLWQIREFIYPGLTEKPLSENLPKELELQHSERLSLTANISGEQAIALLEMTPYAWRANDKVRHEIQNAKFDALEIDFVINVMTRK